MSEKPVIYLDGERFAAMSDQERASVLYGGQFRLIGNLSQWVTAHPEEAARARAIGQDNNRVGRDRLQRAADLRKQVIPQRDHIELTPEVQAARQEFDEAKCRAMFAGDGASKLEKVDPAAYHRLQLSAKSFEVIGLHSTFKISDAARRNVEAVSKESTVRKGSITFEQLREQILAKIPKP